jgi:hypothetical protein
MQRSIGMVENPQGASSYLGFVNWQILGIVRFQNEAKQVFNIVSICTNLKHSHLSKDNLEILISIYKKWPNLKMVWNAQIWGLVVSVCKLQTLTTSPQMSRQNVSHLWWETFWKCEAGLYSHHIPGS